LLETIRATGAERVGVTHGYIPQMVRWLREQGMDAFSVPTRYTGETGEEAETEAAETSDEAPTVDGLSPDADAAGGEVRP
jgi:putative mRNA 3-end processing factor